MSTTRILEFTGADLRVTKLGVSSNVEVGAANLFVDTLTGRVGLGTTAPTQALDVHGNVTVQKQSTLFAGSDVIRQLPKHDRPLTKYPEVAMTANSSGGYVASASSSYDTTGTYSPWRVFDGVINTDENWISLDNPDTYSPSTGIATSQDSLNGQNGSYVTLELPKPIKPYYVKLYHRPSSAFAPRAPKSGYVYGSNDNTSWTQLGSFSYSSLTGGDSEYKHIQLDSNNKKYKYLAFQVTTLFTTGAHYDAAAIRELEYWGTEEGDESVDIVHTSIPNKPGTQHLEVYWDANDTDSYSGSGTTVNDLSGNDITGTISGNAGFDSTYKAWTFDGTGDYISGTQGLGTGQPVHSQSVWFRRDTTYAGYQWMTMIGADGGGLASGFVLLDDGITLQTSSFGNDIRTISTVEGEWYHATFVYGGGEWTSSNVITYVNGQIATETSATRNYSFSLGGSDLRLGSRFANTEYFRGSIANFRLFSKALNPDQVRELYEYDAPRFGHRTNVVALHKGNLGVGVSAPTSRFEVAGADGVFEYPPQAMTGYETYMEGHGVFRAISDDPTSNAGYRVWNLFDKTDGYGWTETGDFTTGVYTGSTTLGSHSGRYAILHMPYSIKLKQIRLQPRSGVTNRFPADYKILGSNDNGSSWTLLATFTGKTYTDEYEDINSDTAFSSYAIVISKLNNLDASGDRIILGEWRLFGTPAPSSLEDGHLTLGKALTAPRVSGHPAGAETPRAESLVVHYDTTVDSVVSGTTVVDTSGNGSNGTLTNGADYSSSKRAFTFDATSSQYISSSTSSASGNFVHTISMWFNGTNLTPSTGDTLFWMGDNTDNKRIEFYIENDLLAYNFRNNAYNATHVFQNNRWYHLVCTYNGTQGSGGREIYLDGTKLAGTHSGNLADLNITNNVFNVGGFSGTSTDYMFTGSISNFKLWNVALTADEVAAEYALGRTGKAINVTDTAVCVGGTVPRAQLDVRGSARIDGRVIVGPPTGTDTQPTQPNSYLQIAGSNENQANAIVVDSMTNTGTGSGIMFRQQWYDQTPTSLVSTGAIHGYRSVSNGNFGGGLQFWTQNGGTFTNKMSINHLGNVGIGRTAPVSVFNTYAGSLYNSSDSTYSSKVVATFEVGRGGGSNGADQGTGAIIELRHDNDDYRYATIESVSEATYSTDIGLRFKTVDESTGPEERMRIDAHGNVGIGTASPAQGTKLHIYSPFTNESKIRIEGRRTNETPVYHTAWVQKGAAGDRSIQQESYPHSSSSDIIHQWLSWNSAGNGWDYPMQLTAGGNLTITGSYSPSDDRLKTNEVYLENATETLMKLKPQKYDKHKFGFIEISPEEYSNVVDGNVFIESVNKWFDVNDFNYSPTENIWYKRTLSDDTHEEAGLIAQDIWYDAPELRYIVSVPSDAQIPEIKPERSDDPTIDPDYETWGRKNATVNYTYMIPYLIKSNQELKLKNDALEARIEALENA